MMAVAVLLTLSTVGSLEFSADQSPAAEPPQMHLRTISRAVSRILPPLFLVMVLCGFFFSAPTWHEISKSIAEKHPEVQEITTDTLLTRLQRPAPPLIYDVREQEEYEVSHLPGAVHTTDPDAIKPPRNTEIVVYCSVGLRSAAFAAKLMKKGYPHVYNLKGSIFEWANKSYPLERGEGEKVKTVHPYNRRWGVLLNKDLQQYSID